MTDPRFPLPHRAVAPYDWAAVLALIRAEFAFMAGRIDPPSSMLTLTEAALAAQAATGEVWVTGTPPIACMVLTPRPHGLYLGKLAVAGARRGQGLARALIAVAEARAQAMGLPLLELQTRVELTANHATFRRLGFTETARTAHPGFDRPTTITFQRPVPKAPA
ncbi:MAG: GNAT family N-acetyltransferase [Pseudomonadota bacterium]